MIPDEQLARALGWAQPGYAWKPPEGYTGEWGSSRDYDHPRYSESLSDCAIAEAEIARRGLHNQYAVALHEMMYAATPEAEREGKHWTWFCTFAPPDVRVRAMLRVLA